MEKDEKKEYNRNYYINNLERRKKYYSKPEIKAREKKYQSEYYFSVTKEKRRLKRLEKKKLLSNKD